MCNMVMSLGVDFFPLMAVSDTAVKSKKRRRLLHVGDRHSGL